MSDPYVEYIAAKQVSAARSGFSADIDVSYLFPFQRACVRWALSQGRAALFADTGLGKTRMQLEWARHVADHEGGRVLIVAPLAVGPQTAREAASVGIDATFARHPEDARATIAITNYDNIERWDADEFAGVVLDESSILKSFMGRTSRALIDRFARTPYRLCATATPSPNDHTELGMHSEFLGVLDRAGMLARWFVNDLSDTGTFRLKGHAVRPFWDWVSSWARCVGKPSDIGSFDDTAYDLPRLHVKPHTVSVDIRVTDGSALFRQPGLSATSLHDEKRRTATARASHVAALVAENPDDAWIIWVDTDYDAGAIMAALPSSAVEVSGSMSPEMKSDRLLAFAEHGGVLVSKPKIAGFGMNFQNCANVVFAGGTYSYEAFYQAIRRCWRFGQKREVTAHVVMAATEMHMWHVVSRKGDDHDEMKVQMFSASRRAVGTDAAKIDYKPTHDAAIPGWLRSYR